MKIGYADPPYLGCCHLYGHRHEDWGCWDNIWTHRELIDLMVNGYPDGWAMSASSVSLQQILPLCPPDVRVMAWVKPFAVFKPNVGVAYAWEPVIVRGGRKIGRHQPTARDWVSCNVTLQRGLVGAKPEKVFFWLFQIMNMKPEDEFVDIFPGTGGGIRAWESFKSQSDLFEAA